MELTAGQKLKITPKNPDKENITDIKIISGSATKIQNTDGSWTVEPKSDGVRINVITEKIKHKVTITLENSSLYTASITKQNGENLRNGESFVEDGDSINIKITPNYNTILEYSFNKNTDFITSSKEVSDKINNIDSVTNIHVKAKRNIETDYQIHYNFYNSKTPCCTAKETTKITQGYNNPSKNCFMYKSASYKLDNKSVEIHERRDIICDWKASKGSNRMIQFFIKGADNDKCYKIRYRVGSEVEQNKNAWKTGTYTNLGTSKGIRFAFTVEKSNKQMYLKDSKSEGRKNKMHHFVVEFQILENEYYGPAPNDKKKINYNAVVYNKNKDDTKDNKKDPDDSTQATVDSKGKIYKTYIFHIYTVK